MPGRQTALAVLVLLAGLVSSCESGSTLTEFVTQSTDGEAASAERVMVVVPPTASVPARQVTVVDPEQFASTPPIVADRNVMPAGRLSVIVQLLAGDGPWLVTSIVQVAIPFTCPNESAVLVTARS